MFTFLTSLRKRAPSWQRLVLAFVMAGAGLHAAMAAQVSDTPLMDATREFTQDSPASNLGCSASSTNCQPGIGTFTPPSVGSATIGQGSGPSLTGTVTSLPPAPSTSAQPPDCGSQLLAVQAQAGSNYVCSCPSGATSETAPQCLPTCQAQLPAAQASAGSNYSCSCPNGGGSTSSPQCVPICHPPQWWTDTWAGNSQNVWPMEYWNRLYIQGGHVIQPIDISGEGYGNGQAVTVPSPNGWVYDPNPGFSDAVGGAWVVPLYPSVQAYQQSVDASGWVTIFDTGAYNCYGQGSCSWDPYGVRYVANGYGLNPSVTFQGNWLSLGGSGGVTPGVQGISCYHNGSNSSCFQSTAQTQSCTVQCSGGRYGGCYQSCNPSDVLPAFNAPATPPACS